MAKTYEFNATQWLEWELERPEGNLTVFAPTATEAVRTLAEHGIMNVNPKKLIKHDRLLSDLLKKEEIQ